MLPESSASDTERNFQKLVDGSNFKSDGQNISDHLYSIFHQPAADRYFIVSDLVRAEEKKREIVNSGEN